jgi:hypothetical protein
LRLIFAGRPRAPPQEEKSAFAALDAVVAAVAALVSFRGEGALARGRPAVPAGHSRPAASTHRLTRRPSARVQSRSRR